LRQACWAVLDGLAFGSGSFDIVFPRAQVKLSWIGKILSTPFSGGYLLLLLYGFGGNSSQTII
jgi:hypothetical protein